MNHTGPLLSPLSVCTGIHVGNCVACGTGVANQAVHVPRETVLEDGTAIFSPGYDLYHPSCLAKAMAFLVDLPDGVYRVKDGRAEPLGG